MEILEEIEEVWKRGYYAKALGLCKELWPYPEVMREISTQLGPNLSCYPFLTFYILETRYGSLWIVKCKNNFIHGFDFEKNEKFGYELKAGLDPGLFKSVPLRLFYEIESALKENKMLDQFLEEIKGWKEIEKKNADEFVESFCKQLGFKIKREVKSGIEDLYLYLVDTSSLGIKASKETPLLLIRTTGLDEKKVESMYRGIEKILFDLNLKEYLVFGITIGDSRRLKELSRKSVFDLIVLDEEKIKNILAKKDFEKELVNNILTQRNLSTISPYETEAPVRGRMFYGREDEKKILTRRMGECFAIIGSRRIGKTSLMFAIMDHLRLEGSYTPFLIDCSLHTNEVEFIGDVTEKLEAKELFKNSRQTFPNFLKRICIAKYNGKVIFLLDESDHLLSYDRSRNWSLIRILRAAFQEGYCRFIVSGFKELLREKEDLTSEVY